MNENMLEVFFQGMFQFAGEIEEKTIIRMAEKKEVGNDFSYCTYRKDDEDYKEGFVVILFFEPFVEEDLVLHIENSIFYDKMICFLNKICTNNDKLSNIEKYLSQIKKDLDIK